MHLRFDDVHTTCTTVTEWTAFQVVYSDQAGDDRIDDTFRDFVAVSIDDGVTHHGMSDVPHHHRTATWQRKELAFGCAVIPVGRHRAFGCAVTLLEFRRECAFHQAEPVPVGDDLVFRIDRSDRIFQILDRSHRGFEYDITEPCRMTLALRDTGIELHLDMQAMIPEQQPRHDVVSVAISDKIIFVAQ